MITQPSYRKYSNTHWCCSRAGLCLSGNKQSTVVNSWIRRTSQRSSARGAFAGPLRQQGEVWAGIICDCAHALRSWGFTLWALWVWEVSSWVYFPSLYRTPCMFPARGHREFGYEMMQATSTYVITCSPVLLNLQNLKTTFCLSHENAAPDKERLSLTVWFLFSLHSRPSAGASLLGPVLEKSPDRQWRRWSAGVTEHAQCSFPTDLAGFASSVPLRDPLLLHTMSRCPGSCHFLETAGQPCPLSQLSFLITRWRRGWPEFTQRLLIRTHFYFRSQRL